MNITRETDGTKLILALEGRLDTTTAPVFETEVNAITDDIKQLELNFGKLEYLSSAGLRIILAAQKQMNRQGEMVIVNVNTSIQEVFDITGFADILTIR
ncbi:MULTISPECIES: STAS domain-containing protein [unclassified Fusibacter]|uniref:STAS domain-containing protein n=1 Tax=unclassified Fusibacter TaxID=2624464 RepID=UPI001010624F|nr:MULTISPECIES: STAS domain-containing protein [unclassified Fusibacter]MCK8058471.1 STAS domain-containing protein [Fusibacter sp. A2]NPE22761.1 STAS domain-containing protein [Fusibacter sp. A1]RXV60319.1 anti-sigma factor antagonist [Fusibacter sp. A1]